MNALARVLEPAGEAVSLSVAALPCDANVNALTGLSTDYLNHFNEAIMLLDMIPVMPDAATELAAWRPLTYREHFEKSHLRHRALIIAAYEAAEPLQQQMFERLCRGMRSTVLAARDILTRDLEDADLAQVATDAAARLKALVGQASTVIHGFAEAANGPATIDESQDAIDAILRR
ncbi:MAG: hypothetical protein QOD74_2155 [Variibacter sp.]|jgi:hypothetical protein|nr:hypothetical protein [Variibacter sp.]